MDLQYLKGVGEKRAALFAKLNVFSVEDLLELYPRSYIDLSSAYSTADAPVGMTCCVKAVVTQAPQAHYIRKNMILYKACAEDDAGRLDIVIFNNPYSAEKLKKGAELLFYGKVVSERLGEKKMTSPLVFSVDIDKKLIPVYPQTNGLTSAVIEKAVGNAINLHGDVLKDPLDEDMRLKYKLCHMRFAVESIHRPDSVSAVDAARRRLIFDEFLCLQLGMKLLRARKKEKTPCVFVKNYSDEFWGSLPFEPTGAQRRASDEIYADMSSEFPMSRLLQGDVGSGKTAVAAAACFNAVKNGYQAVIMAPTEILAQQHYKSISALYEGSGIKIELLTGSVKASVKKKEKERLLSGEINIVIGTHALLTDDVAFNKLGLVVTDEQHRFGVAQRASLISKGDNPHVLVMSATPIPRTLALIIYGELDISVLDEMPPGRQKISTYAVGSDKRERAYNYLKKHLDRGLQGYVVCPMVEEGENDLAAAVSYAEETAQGQLDRYSVGVLHGKMKPAEKERIMREFSEGKIQVLVSTTVIEVGVDVPNAAVMIIENAERFGLSQLHQLRGRVGRGKEQSSCILISDAKSETARKRLAVMCETCDGFRIADEDLRLRGAGDFFGKRQHGLPEFKLADMVQDSELLRLSGKAAREILERDSSLEKKENEELRRQVEKLFRNASEASMN